MKKQRRPGTFKYGILASMILILVGGVGCDQIEASRALVESTLSDIQATDHSESGRAADPDVDSIGPEEAQRIYYQFDDDSGQVQFVE